MCLGNISNDFTILYIRKTELKEVVKYSSVVFNPVDTNNIFDIHQYLMKRT